MPFTQLFDQFFAIATLIIGGFYLLRSIVGLVLLAIGTIPTAIGTKAKAASARITPRLILRIVGAVTGVAITGTGIGATVATAAPTHLTTTSTSSGQIQTTSRTAATSVELLPPLDRGPSKAGSASKPNAPDKSPGAVGQKATRPTTDPAPAATATKPTKSLQSDKPTETMPPSSTARPANHPGATASTSSTVTVKPGDSLWAIAARQLGDKASDSEIDREWRRWYQANHNVVGANPNLIFPGMKLKAPTK